MNSKIDPFLEAIQKIAPNRYLQALLIIILFYGAAKILDIFTTRVIGKWVKKSKITADDQILDIFQKPIFVSIMLLALALATERIELPQTIHFLTLSGLKTVAVFIWAKAGLRFMQLMLRLVSRDGSRFALIQEQTLPLFTNLLVIIVCP